MATTQDTYAAEKVDGDLHTGSLKDVESSSPAEPQNAGIADPEAERSYGTFWQNHQKPFILGDLT